MYCDGGSGGQWVARFHHFYRLTVSTQAQFILSPDRTFSKTGAVSKTKYHDRFTQYKRFIVKHLNTPRMKELFAQYNVELFPANLPDLTASPSPGMEQELNEEAVLSHAFRDTSVQGTSNL